MKVLAIAAFVAMSTDIARAAAPDPTTSAPVTAAPTASTSAMPASTDPARNAPTQVSTTGWKLECAPGKTSLACRAVDQITASGGLVVALTLVPRADGRTELSIDVPLGVAVATPVKLAVGIGTPQGFPYLVCSQQGCFASGPVDPALLAAMRSAKSNLAVSYRLVMANLSERNVDASLSLAGFAEVVDKLK